MDLSKVSEILDPPKESELFLALKIEVDEVKSAFWKIENEKVKIVALGDRAEWGGAKEELVVACDSSISSAVVKLQETGNEAPRNLVLGLPDFWVKDNKIISEKLEVLNFLAKKLSLNPLGFVVIPEAICYYLKNLENSLPSAILVYLGANEINISLLEKEKLIKTEVVGRSDNLALDVEEGVLRFIEEQNLPSRILLYNSQDLEEAKQTLISYPWQPPEKGIKPGFLHLPKVEILSSGVDIEAIAFAGGKEISKSQPVVEEKTEKDQIEETPEVQPPPEEPQLATEEKKILFLKDEDILKESKYLEKETIKEEQIEKPEEELKVEEVITPETFPKKETFLKIKNPISFFTKKIGTFLRFLTRKIFVFKGLRGRCSPLVRRLFLGVVSVCFFIFLGFYFFAKAEVILMVARKEEVKEFEFKMDPNLEKIDEQGKIIPAKLISVEVSDRNTIQTTGKKTVGEKAKGEVIIYNRTDSGKSFSAGNVLVGPGKLKFLLDTEVKVASKTPDLTSGIDRWGEAKVGVTAEQIGVQYNIAGQSQLYFENFPSSSFLAKNQVAFLGGTSRQISVVSKDDQGKLLVDLTDRLKKNANEELKKKVSQNEILISETFDLKIKSTKFNHEIQDESPDLTLDLKGEGESLLIIKDDLDNLALSLLSSEIPEDYQVEKGKSEFSFLTFDKKESKLKVKAKITLKMKVNIEEIIKKIKGKSTFEGKQIISELGFVRFVQINVKPGLFGFLSRLPFKEGNIILTIETE